MQDCGLLLEGGNIYSSIKMKQKKINYFSDPIFSSNFHLLEKYELSFDLQCNPNQLKDAAKFFVQFPKILVVLDHIGSLKLNGNDYHDQSEIELWKE